MLTDDAALRMILVFWSTFVVNWFKFAVDEHVVLVHVINFWHGGVNWLEVSWTGSHFLLRDEEFKAVV